MTTKICYAVDGNGRLLAAVITGGQRNDGAMLAYAVGLPAQARELTEAPQLALWDADHTEEPTRRTA